MNLTAFLPTASGQLYYPVLQQRVALGVGGAKRGVGAAGGAFLSHQEVLVQTVHVQLLEPPWCVGILFVIQENDEALIILYLR